MSVQISFRTAAKRHGFRPSMVRAGSAVLALAASLGTAACASSGSSESLEGESVVQRSSALSTTSVTEAGDDQRTGWYGNQPRLSPSIVAGSTFGQLFSVPVNGQIYAQPLVSQGTLFVVTETNDIYGLDPESGAQRWHRTVGTAFDPNTLGCGDLVPTIGVTGTPVIDSATNTAYFFAKVSEGTGGNYYAHAVDVATGAEKPNFPVKVQGTASNRAGLTFNATNHLQRPGLLLMGGKVYAAFGGHCDVGNYQGWIASISTDGSAQTLWSANTDVGAGIWQSGGGITSDGAGRMFVATGNGGYLEPTIAGTQAGNLRNLGEAIVRVDVQSNGTLKAADFYSPYDAKALDGWDADFASGAPVALPDSFGTTAYPHLLLAVGKQGYLYLLNRDRLGGIGAPGSEGYVSRVGPSGGVWSKPAVWPGDGGYVYVPTASGGNAAAGSAGYFYAYQLKPDATNTPTLVQAGTSPDAFGFSSSRPVVTSDGTASGTALVWIIWSQGGSGIDAQLRAYNAVPPPNKVWEPLRSFSIGRSSKFNPPGVGNGRVYVGTRDGHVLAFGSPVTPALSASPAQFGNVAIGNSSIVSVSISASQALTIQGLQSSSPEFVVGTPASSTLAAGATTTVPVTFRPTSTGVKAASLVINTSAGSASAPLSGNALSATAELTLSAPALSFGGTTVGGTLSQQIVLTNSGATALTLQGFTGLSAPFSAQNLPAAGTSIAPSASLAITLVFSPTAAGSFIGQFKIQSSGGSATLPLSGIAGAPAHLSIVPLTIDFGRVPVTGTRFAKFELRNTGGIPLTITKSKPPVASAFAAKTELAEGTQIGVNQTITEWVAYTPSTEGVNDDVWVLNSTADNGQQQVAFLGTGVSGGVTSASTTNWQFNGSTLGSPNNFVLTDAVGDQAGTAFWKTALPSNGLDIAFDTVMGAGGGADGMALVLADAALSTPTSLGLQGGGLGYAGIRGIAVAFDTYPNGQDPSDNFVGITDGTIPGTNDALNWLATATNVPPLRGIDLVTHHVHVFSATPGAVPSVLVVEVDGVEVLRKSVALPGSVYVGFSAGTGGVSDRHSVTNVSILSQGSTNTTVAAVLGFENASLWTASNSAAVSSSTVVSQGVASLGVASFYYTEVTSVPIGSVGAVGPNVSFDLRPPANLTYGSVQFTLDAPSVGLYNRYLGQQNLAGSTANTYRTFSFPLPADVRAALQGTYSDLRLKIAISAARFETPYLLDNIRF